jgi:hypothetical protein
MGALHWLDGRCCQRGASGRIDATAIVANGAKQ